MNKYAFGENIILLNGIPLSGFAEGDDVIQVKRRNDTFSDKVGADGQMTVVRSSDLSGEITLKFMQGSSGSATLESALALQSVPRVFVPSQFSVYNPVTGEKVASTACYIKKTADFTRGAGLNSEEWVLVCENIYVLRTIAGVFGAAVNGLASFL